MSEFIIKAVKREKGQKQVAKRGIASGKLPAVIYNKDENHTIELDRTEFYRVFKSAKSNSIFTVDLDGDKKDVIIQNYTETIDKANLIDHIDFLLVKPDVPVKVRVPITTTGLPVGVTLGGTLELPTSAVRVKCLSKDIPSNFELEVGQLNIGDTIHVSSIEVPEGVTIQEPPEKIIVTVMGSSRLVAQNAADKPEVEE